MLGNGLVEEVGDKQGQIFQWPCAKAVPYAAESIKLNEDREETSLWKAQLLIARRLSAGILASQLVGLETQLLQSAFPCLQLLGFR